MKIKHQFIAHNDRIIGWAYYPAQNTPRFKEAMTYEVSTWLIASLRKLGYIVSTYEDIFFLANSLDGFYLQLGSKPPVKYNVRNTVVLTNGKVDLIADKTHQGSLTLVERIHYVARAYARYKTECAK